MRARETRISSKIRIKSPKRQYQSTETSQKRLKKNIQNHQKIKNSSKNQFPLKTHKSRRSPLKSRETNSKRLSLILNMKDEPSVSKDKTRKHILSDKFHDEKFFSTEKKNGYRKKNSQKSKKNYRRTPEKKISKIRNKNFQGKKVVRSPRRKKNSETKKKDADLSIEKSLNKKFIATRMNIKTHLKAKREKNNQKSKRKANVRTCIRNSRKKNFENRLENSKSRSRSKEKIRKNESVEKLKIRLGKENFRGSMDEGVLRSARKGSSRKPRGVRASMDCVSVTNFFSKKIKAKRNFLMKKKNDGKKINETAVDHKKKKEKCQIREFSIEKNKKIQNSPRRKKNHNNLFQAKFLSIKKIPKLANRGKIELQVKNDAMYKRAKNRLKYSTPIESGKNFYSRDIKQFFLEKKIESNFALNFRDHFTDTYETIQQFRHFRPKRLGSLNKKKIKLEKMSSYKKLLILDMDEAMIRADFIGKKGDDTIVMELEPGKKFHVRFY